MKTGLVKYNQPGNRFQNGFIGGNMPVAIYLSQAEK